MNRLAYFFAIVVGATTPLAIKLGADVFSPIAGLTLRILLAFLCGLAGACVLGVRLKIRNNWPLYLAASIGLFPNLVLVYAAVNYISSGLVALLFGIQPFFTAILMRPILGESGLRPRKVMALFIALGGLALILLDGDSLKGDLAIGVGLMLVSGLLFSASALWVKRLNRALALSAFEQTLGGMALSLPGLCVSWWLIGGVEPIDFTPVALVSLLYLALVVSLAGFAAYYFILGRMPVETVALIPMITPVAAIALGVVFLGESITVNMVSGAALFLLALAIHQDLRVDTARAKP